jgi:hypothetical protein
VIWRWLTRAALIGALAAHPKARHAVTVVASVVIFVFGYWFLSSFFVTLDSIESAWLRAGFVAAVAALVAVVSVGALASLGWLRRPGTRAQEPRRPSRERLDELYAKYGIAAPHGGAGRSSTAGGGSGPPVAVIGMPQTGRTTLVTALSEMFARRAGVAAPRFVELPALEASAGGASDAIAMTADFDVVLLVVDDDLKSHEMAALDAVIRLGKPAIVVLARSDRLRGEERAEILAALSERVADLSPRPEIVAVSADPAPRVVEVISGDGPSDTVVRKPARIIAPLADALDRALRRTAAGGRSVG